MHLLLKSALAALFCLLICLLPALAATSEQQVMALIEQRRFNQALEKLTPLLAAHPNNNVLLFYKLQVLRGLNRWNDMAQVIQALKKIRPGSEGRDFELFDLNMEVLQHTGHLREIVPACDAAAREFPQQSTKFAIKKIWAYALSSNRQNVYKSLSKIRPTSLSKEQQVEILAWYARLGKIPQTLPLANLICKNSRLVSDYLTRAQILCLLNRREEALATCARGLGFHDDMQALRLLNILNRKLVISKGNVSDLVDRVAVIFPSPEVTALNLKAFRMQSQEDYQPSIKDLNRALTLEPWNLQSLLLRSIAFEKSEMHKEALADLNTALLWSPDYPEAFRWRADIYWRTGDARAELADRVRYADLRPRSFEALKLCAESCLKCHQPAQALVRMQQAELLHVPVEYLAALKGQALFDLKKRAEVVAYLTPILKISLANEERLKMLTVRAKAYKQLGATELARKDEARVAELQQAIFLNPNPHPVSK